MKWKCSKSLLKRKRFRSAGRPTRIPEAELSALAHSALVKGVAASAAGLAQSAATERELVAYSRQVLGFVAEVLNIAARHSAQIFASVVSPDAPRPPPGHLRKDYVYLFERYFYFLETLPPRARGLVVFDEFDKARSHILVQQMAAYFLGTETGRYRSSRIIPEPLFVHSDLTTGIFLADLTAYVLGWTWRQSGMTAPRRDELHPFCSKLVDMQFRGEKPNPSTGTTRALRGVLYLDDLRPRTSHKKK